MKKGEECVWRLQAGRDGDGDGDGGDVDGDEHVGSVCVTWHGGMEVKWELGAHWGGVWC